MEKMQAAVILTAATVTLALDNVASAGAFECEADHQCDSGYCYLETGKCVPCIDCASYLRQTSQWRTCARGPQDCGECLAGFEYEYLTDGTARSFCVRKKEIEYGIWNEKSPYLWIIIASCLVTFILLLVFAVHRFYKGVKARSSVQNNDPNPEDPPPLSADNEIPPPSYDSSVPLLQPSGVSSALCTSLIVVEKEGSSLQQAVPFTIPDPPYGTGGLIEFENEAQDSEAEDIHQLQDSDDNEASRAISPPQLEDEDTMPSEWVPFRESTAVTEEASFEERSSVASSLSDISEGAASPSAGQEVLNDSGVSASCSHQSDLSFAHGVEGLDILSSSQDSTANSIHSALQRRRSEEDLSLADRKRQRRDSGSSSMISVETYREKA
ncbi:hypothetical protein R5R35_006856 [Gryllus longicercus]|uniref:TNFR-Cys domain-containing protein n=1 Tax=Gryllus longicercus TaxID=2509291 RepID=A0AAN9VHA1_9ORTH